MAERATTTGRVILGTMRLHETWRSPRELANFLAQASDLGVNKLHSSDEYGSYPLLCAALAELQNRRPDVVFRHIVKLANPGFEDKVFGAGKLETRLAKYCDDLGTTKIEDVQWMWRSGLDDDIARVQNFQNSSDQISTAAKILKNQNIITRLLCFPYSPDFAIAAVESGIIDGLTVYRNVMETEYDTAILRATTSNMPTLIIRPFNAGATLNNRNLRPRVLFDDALDMAGIEAGIVSTSKLDHLRELVL